jgi:hypothetical protein
VEKEHFARKISEQQKQRLINLITVQNYNMKEVYLEIYLGFQDCQNQLQHSQEDLHPFQKNFENKDPRAPLRRPHRHCLHLPRGGTIKLAADPQTQAHLNNRGKLTVKNLEHHFNWKD